MDGWFLRFSSTYLDLNYFTHWNIGRISQRKKKYQVVCLSWRNWCSGLRLGCYSCRLEECWNEGWRTEVWSGRRVRFDDGGSGVHRIAEKEEDEEDDEKEDDGSLNVGFYRSFENSLRRIRSIMRIRVKKRKACLAVHSQEEIQDTD